MRALFAALLILLVPAPARADSISENARRSPRAADVIAALYRFDQFQLSSMEAADVRGNQEVRTFALARIDAAEKRDKALKQIEIKTGVDLKGRSASPAADLLASLLATDGPSYIRKFYETQVVEYRSVIAVLQHYLQWPDNDAVRTFAREQLHLLRAESKTAEAAIAEK
jgi:predicted outer membrane protein